MALVTAPDVYQPEVLSLINELTEAYQKIEGIEYATGLTNTLEFTATEWGVEVGRLVRQDELPKTATEAMALRRRVEANPRLSGNLVSSDGTLAAIQLRFASGSGEPQSSNFATAQRVGQVTEQLLESRGSAGETEVYFGGLPFLMYNMTMLIVGNLTTLIPLMVGLLVLVLYLGLRRWTGVVYPLAVVLVSSVLVLGVMGVFGLQMDLLSGLVPIVLIALGSADGIHYMKRYYERRSSGESAAAAAAGSFQEIRIPLILTTITTMVGFGSLAISDFAVIRQFGLLTALGLFLALVVTLTLLPALAAFGAGAPRPQTTRVRGNAMDGLARGVARAPGIVLAAGLVTVVVAGTGLLLIVKSVDWTLCLKRGSSPYHAEMLIREKLGGSLPIQLLVRGDLLDPATLLAMRKLERRMDALPRVGRSYSLASIIAEMNAAMNGRYAIPSTREGVANLWFLIEDEDEVEQLVAAGATTEGLVQARITDWETDAVIQSVEGVDGWLESRTDRMVVIDTRALENVPDAAVREYRAADLATQLRWEFAGREVEAPSRLGAIASAFIQWTPDAAARSRVRDAVLRYLASPEAEVTLATEPAVWLAGVLSGGAAEWGIDAASADRAVRVAAPAIDDQDREALALSLESVTYDAVGGARVASAMAVLAGESPEIARDGVLRRNLSGAFWEAHGPLVVLNDAVAQRWGLGDSAATRVVSATIGRSGMASVLKQMEEELLPTQVESVLLTLVVVLGLLSFIFRSPVAGLVMIIPLAATIVLNFGVMGYLSIGLDSFTAMVASIAIGLGVDYAIHFTHRYRRELAAAGGRALVALTNTMRTSGVAILVNALSVGLGFLVLLAAGGQHVRRFGGLTSLAMLAAGLFTLLLLPALYVRYRPRFLQVGVQIRQGGADAPALTSTPEAEPV
ncbi:MAG: RND family transporter, partial [Gemmatimonadales bacterium]